MSLLCHGDTSPDGKRAVITAEADPNGSLNHIAGIYSPNRNVLGLMPHPENLIDGLVGGTDGRGMFESLVSGRKAA